MNVLGWMNGRYMLSLLGLYGAAAMVGGLLFIVGAAIFRYPEFAFVCLAAFVLGMCARGIGRSLYLARHTMLFHRLSRHP